MDTLILCGGKGTRLQPVVSNLPKILVEIYNRPFIEYLLNKLEFYGMKKVVLCTGYMHHLIEEWVTLSYHGNLKILFSDEYKPLGTAGAIRNAKDFISSEYFMVLNGDTYSDICYRSFVNDFLNNKSFASIAITNAKNVSDYGSIVIDKNGRLISFSEKTVEKDNSFVNLGAYIFKKEIINEIAINKKVSLEIDTIPNSLKLRDKPINTFIHQGLFFDYGNPKRLEKINKLKLDFEIT